MGAGNCFEKGGGFTSTINTLQPKAVQGYKVCRGGWMWVGVGEYGMRWGWGTLLH